MTPTSESVGQFFDHATAVFCRFSKSPYINLGYWRGKTSIIATAQRALVETFGAFCAFERNTKILDVGFGTGAQDILWMNSYKPMLIHGINVSPYQVMLANEKATATDSTKRFIYEVGDACRLPEHLRDFDCAVGLECAHLFQDISSFFSSLHRVLAEGGRVCLANISYKTRSAFEENILEGIEEELKDFNLEPYRQLISTTPAMERGRALLFDEMLSLAQREGFKVNRMVDITKRVESFYPAFRKATSDLIQQDLSSIERTITTACAISFYLRKHQFENGSLGYYFIEFLKT